MTEIWGEISKATSIGVQFVKEKAGVTKSDVDPEFESARERFKIIKDQFNTLKNDLNSIIQESTAAAHSGLCISDSIQQEIEVNNAIKTKTLDAATNFFNRNQQMLDDYFIKLLDKNVVDQFKQYLAKIDELSELKKSRVKQCLYVSSLKNDINLYAKDGKSKKLVKAKLDYKEHKDTLEKQTKEFIESVNELWKTKTEIQESIMFEFVSISFSFAKLIYGNLKIMQNQML